MRTIQWFPGHMAKARREIKEKMKLIDVAIELVDARIPMSSRSPIIEQLAANRPHLLLLNKADLAEATTTKKWENYFRGKGADVLTINARSGKGVGQIVPRAKALLAEKHERDRKKGIRPRPPRAVILGIPNVGKSTLINRLAGRKMADIGDRPGITRKDQWLKLKGRLELLDTPGILWPKFDDPQTGLKLAATGAIKEELFEFYDVALYVLRFLKERNPRILIERYHLSSLAEEAEQLLAQIGKQRGTIVSGGEVDFDKAAEVVIRDVRAGKLGRISFESPQDAEIDQKE